MRLVIGQIVWTVSGIIAHVVVRLPVGSAIRKDELRQYLKHRPWLVTSIRSPERINAMFRLAEAKAKQKAEQGPKVTSITLDELLRLTLEVHEEFRQIPPPHTTQITFWQDGDCQIERWHHDRESGQRISTSETGPSIGQALASAHPVMVIDGIYVVNGVHLNGPQTEALKGALAAASGNITNELLVHRDNIREIRRMVLGG
jgi:hypothetical protein